MKQDISTEIKRRALELGFDAVGISRIRPLEKERARLESWLARAFHGDMGYMERNIDKRTDPAKLVEGARSVVSVLLNYYPGRIQKPESVYKISKYAYGADYHFVLKNKLRPLMDWIESEFPDTPMRAFTDSAPVLDKSWAQAAGLGWLGKHSLLINKKIGSFFFIGEIILGLDLTPDNPLEQEYCGTCTRCIDACPTGAITAPYVLDANRCISFLTIETKKEIPDALAAKFDNWIFGCDICQDVCPWNSKAQPAGVPEFRLSDALFQMRKEDWEQMDKPLFNRLFKQSPVKRAGFNRLKSTILKVKEAARD
jgi:epoxyqueuosine reductase